MENGKLWSGSKFAKYKTLFPDRFCLYEGCVSSVAANAPTSLCFLYNFIKLLDLLTSIIYNNFDRVFVNPSVECFATYLKGECFLSLSVSPLVKVRVLTKDLTKFVRSFIMIYL